MIALVAAVADNGVIGKNNSLPWHIPEDFRHFKALTTGKHILMGRKTFESLGKPLPNRVHLVITRQTNYRVPESVRLFSSIDDAFDAHPNTDIMVIGGGEIYAQTIDRADRLYITEIHETYEGDVAFPTINPHMWQETEREDHGGYSFVVYRRLI